MLIFSREAPAQQPSSALEPFASVRKTAGDILIAAGVVVSFVALTHSLVIWTPPHFGSPPWEFAAATQTIDVFPLAITGSALLACGALVRGWRRGMLALAALYALSSLVLIALSLLLTLDLGVAWNSVAPAIRNDLAKTGGKAVAFSGAFVLYYWWLTVRLVRFARHKPAPVQ